MKRLKSNFDPQVTIYLFPIVSIAWAATIFVYILLVNHNNLDLFTKHLANEQMCDDYDL